MADKIKTVNNKFECMECRNEVTCDLNQKVDDVIECPYCGIEYEVVSLDGGEKALQIIEEEK
jgi:lysine biosynthesis protein LysW